ncbi:glycosyltransferase family 2 protein [Flavobacterium sp. XS2P12]|uniref:glycosyltransferase family 2 protein n=1 Tax=Flavobacterium melibiosi TaxID=3398734 RepID=UPI003A83A055
MNNPLVSIIIPTYNRAHLISETLDSVLAQTYKNWECIIVDDGSTDNSSVVIDDYVKKDNRFQYHNRPKNRNKGANACRNYGFSISKGQFALFFDSDDILDISILKLCINLSNSMFDFIFYNYQEFSGDIKNITYSQYNNSVNPLLDYFSGKINLATPSIIWKREIINGIQFDESLKKSQELNFIFKVFKKYGFGVLKGIYLCENGFLVRKHEDSIVNSFHQATPVFLLSDIRVRSQLLNYFTILEFLEIHSFNRRLLEKSLRLYFYHSSYIDFINIILKLDCNYKSLLILKIRLLCYKIIYKITDRDYRLNSSINDLFKEDSYLKIN